MEIFAGRQTRIDHSAHLHLLPASHSLPMLPRLRDSAADPHVPLRGESSGHHALLGICALAGFAMLAGSPCWSQQPDPARQLVRETVYNELQDHNRHGYWRYWVQQQVHDGTRLQDQVETADGPIARLVKTNGHPIDVQTLEEEHARLARLMNSPQELAGHRKDYDEDEKHVAVIMSLLPQAYLFEFAGDENGCHHLRFRPSPAYTPRSVEERVAHAMAGDLWIDARMKRLSRLEGHLDENVDFGFGLLGRLDKGGWFRVQRVQVSPTEWKTQRLELHLSGRAVLFKTIARDTNEVRGGFSAVPAGLSMTQGMRLLEQPDPRSAPNSLAYVSPVALAARR